MTDHPEVIMEAVKQDGFRLMRAWRTDRRIVLEAVKWLPNVLCMVTNAWRSDSQIVLEAVRVNGLQLEYASTECRENRDIVLEAIHQNGNFT